MEKTILWHKEIRKCLMELSDRQLDDFLDLLSFIQSNHINNLICESVYSEAELWEWLSSKDQIELNDIKRELTMRVSKAASVTDDEFVQNLGNVGKNGSVKILVLFHDESNVYYVLTVNEFYTGLRSYLAMEKKDDFCRDLQECFPHIVFSEGIDATVNTLNNKFEDIRRDIVDHLTHINDYQPKFLMLENKSFRELAKEFTADTKIECSPQADRDDVRKLKEKHYNTVSRQEETVTCELHTKFQTFNRDREKQDRIYFFPGKTGIKEGKVIVKHIGGHL